MKKSTKILLAGLGIVGIPFTGGASAIAVSSAFAATGVAVVTTSMTTIIGTGVLASTVVGSTKKYIDKKTEKARRDGFRTGQKSGEQTVNEKAWEIVEVVKYSEEYLIALITIGKYVAEIDGTVTQEEMDELNLTYNFIMKIPSVSIQTRNKLKLVIESNVSNEDFNKALANIKGEELLSLGEQVSDIILADGYTSKEEEEFLEMWKGIVGDENRR